MKDPRWPCVAALGPDATELTVHVVPQSRQTQALGLHADALRVRLAAPATEGRANEALVAWLAVQLHVPRRAIELKQGAASRRKRVAITCEAGRVIAWLDALGAGP